MRMGEPTVAFINKIKINTYIYTFLFICVSIGYSLKNSVSIEPFLLLMASFAFYTLGRQVNLICKIEEGIQIDNHPRQKAWIRALTYFTILLILFSVFFF